MFGAHIIGWVWPVLGIADETSLGKVMLCQNQRTVPTLIQVRIRTGLLRGCKNELLQTSHVACIAESHSRGVELETRLIWQDVRGWAETADHIDACAIAWSGASFSYCLDGALDSEFVGRLSYVTTRVWTDAPHGGIRHHEEETVR